MLLINFVCYNLGIVPIKKICEYCNELDTGICCFTKGILARLHHAIVYYMLSDWPIGFLQNLVMPT